MSNSIHNLFAKEDANFLLLSNTEKSWLCKCVALYLFRGCEEPFLSDLCKDILQWTGQETIQFRRNLIFNGHIQKNLKFYLYAYLCGKETRTSDYGVNNDDQTFSRRLLTSDDDYATRLRQKIKTLKQKYPPRSLTSFEEGVNKIVSELDVYCKKFVWKKMRFITDAASVKPQDLVQEVLQFGIYAMYKAYPKIENYLHALNIAKTGIHNRGQNVIKEATALSRTNYITNALGEHSSNTLSIHSGISSEWNFGEAIDFNGWGHVSICNNLMVARDGSSVEGEPIYDCEYKADLKQAIESIKSRLVAEAPRDFLEILMGNYHKGFSNYLKTNSIAVGDNDDWLEQTEISNYAEHARRYLEVPKDIARKFIMRLREELKPFN